MKISRLIKLLQEKQTDHGDIEVTVWHEDNRDANWVPVSAVTYFHNGLVNERTIRIDVEPRRA